MALLSCSIDGAGLYMSTLKPGTLLDYLGMSLGPVGEITSSKYISVVWAERGGPDQPWIATEHFETAFRDDEEPYPYSDEGWALTDAFILEADDHNANGKLEVAAMSIEVCAVSMKELCKQVDDFLYRDDGPSEERAYLITLVAREGEQREVLEAAIRADGTLIKTSRAEDKEHVQAGELAKWLEQLLPQASARAQRHIEGSLKGL